MGSEGKQSSGSNGVGVVKLKGGGRGTTLYGALRGQRKKHSRVGTWGKILTQREKVLPGIEKKETKKR